MSEDLLTMFAQFGPAGLIGVLWIAERRFAVKRERHLSESHRRIVQQEQSVEALLKVVRDNTRAIVSLEHTQRELIATLMTQAAKR